MFKKIDSAIISACAVISGAFHRATGLTHRFIAEIGIALAALSLAVNGANFFYHFFAPEINVATLSFNAFCFCVMIAYRRAHRPDASFLPGRFSPLNITLADFWKLSWLSLLVADIVPFFAATPQAGLMLRIIAGPFFALGMAIFYYFMAVKIIPSAGDKIRETIGGLAPLKEQG